MPTLSRRGLFALGGSGAAATALAACGGRTDKREETDDAAVLGTALAAETALGEAYAAGAGIETSFAAASRRRAADLKRLIDQAGGSGAGSGAAGSGPAPERAEAAIAAYREGAGTLSSAELRRTTIEFLAAVAAELAALRAQAGEDPVPRAFVTGLAEEPHEADGGSDTTTTTTGEGG